MKSLPHQKTCAVEGCEAPSRCRDLCSIHYHRARHRGALGEAHTLESLAKKSDALPSLAERYWSRVAKAGEDECWEWQGARTDRGYGAIRDNGKQRSTTHVAWFLKHGEWPNDLGLWVLHKCDNPPCVNPAHLFLGTHKMNMRDMIEKGRGSYARRLQRGTLTAEERQAIGDRLAEWERKWRAEHGY